MNFQSIANEKINIISIGVSLLQDILRYTKVRHEQSMHVSPSVHTKETLKTTSLLEYSPRENKHTLNGNRIKEHQTTHKEFPF